MLGVWELTTAYARQLKSMSLEERKQEAANRVQRLINSRKGKVTLDMVKRNTRTPEPYSKPSKMTVTEVAQRAFPHQSHVFLHMPNTLCVAKPAVAASLPAALQHVTTKQYIGVKQKGSLLYL